MFSRFALAAALVCCCAAATAENVLLVDKWMLDPVAFKPFFDHFEEAGHDFEYRRYHPTLVKADATDYDVIMVAGGIHPAPAATYMRDEEAALLADFVKNGGTAVLLISRGTTDTWMFNKVLDKLGLKLRIEGDAIMEATGYKSTLIPASYFLNLPYLHATPDTPLGEGVPEWIPGGRVRSILVGQTEGVEVPVITRKAAMRQLGRDEIEGRSSADRHARGLQMVYSGEPTSAYAALVTAKAGEGHVILATRFTFNMNGYTGRWSDKPIEGPYDLAGNRRFEKNFCDYVAAISSGEYTPADRMPLTRIDRIPALEKPGHLETEWFRARALPQKAPRGATDPLEPFETAPVGQLSFLDGEKVRSAFLAVLGDDRDPYLLDRCQQMGMNLIYAMHGDKMYRVKDNPAALQKRVDYLDEYARMCEERGLKVMFGGFSPERRAWQSKQYETVAVDGAGRSYRLPSPFDEESWQDTVVHQGTIFAELANRHPGTVMGCFWDLELYGNPEIIVSEALQFDTATFMRFLDTQPERVRARGRLVDERTRFDWLEKQGLLKAYYRFMENTFYGIVRDTANRFDRIHDEFEWGFYTAGIPQSWYYRGLFRAIDDYQGEVLLVTYEARGLQQASYYASQGVNLLHAPGVLMGIPEGDEWGRFLTLSMENEPGYWLFPVYELPKDEDSWRFKQNDAAFNESPETIVRLVREANDAFDAQAK